VEVAMNLLLVAVKDRDQKIRRSCKGLPASIKGTYLQRSLLAAGSWLNSSALSLLLHRNGFYITPYSTAECEAPGLSGNTFLQFLK
jgi:hypothetical protein